MIISIIASLHFHLHSQVNLDCLKYEGTAQHVSKQIEFIT